MALASAIWLDLPSTKVLNVKDWTKPGFLSSEESSLSTNVDLSRVLKIISFSGSMPLSASLMSSKKFSLTWFKIKSFGAFISNELLVVSAERGFIQVLKSSDESLGFHQKTLILG